MQKGRGWKLVLMCVMLIGGILCLSSCSSVQEWTVAHTNGAEVSVSMDVAGASSNKGSTQFAIQKDGYTVFGEVQTISFVDEMMGSHAHMEQSSDAEGNIISNQTFGTFDINGGTGISYMADSKTYEHLIPVSEKTYIRLWSESQDLLFELESSLKFTLVKDGVDEDADFASHFSE